jgi:hypothetical protein
MIVFNIFLLLCLFWLVPMDGWGICDTFYIQWFVKFYFSNLYLDLLEFEINYNYNYISSVQNAMAITDCTSAFLVDFTYYLMSINQLHNVSHISCWVNKTGNSVLIAGTVADKHLSGFKHWVAHRNLIGFSLVYIPWACSSISFESLQQW